MTDTNWGFALAVLFVVVFWTTIGVIMWACL